jgi:osmoprotectant transport system substrate-binding protein
VGFEFSTRPDGLPALEQHYGFTVPEESLKTGAPGASLIGLENRECDVAMAFGTDAVIAKNNWHVYQDDKAFWPPYDLAPYISTATLEKYPEIEDLINEFVATFPGGGQSATPALVGDGQKAWQALNAQVDVDKMEPDEVAQQYLADKGLIK